MKYWFAKEEVRYENLILVVLVVFMCENVSTLNRLGAEAEDVKDYEYGRCSARGSCGVCRLIRKVRSCGG